MKQRLACLALVLALFATLGFSSTANAADSDAVAVTASVSDVLTLELSHEAITFGSNLNFLGDNAAVGRCSLNPGARYRSPNVSATVQSNRAFDIQRTATGNFPVGRIFVQTGQWVDCATAFTASPLTGDLQVVSNHAASASFTYGDIFYFDVLLTSTAASYGATVTYTAIALS